MVKFLTLSKLTQCLAMFTIARGTKRRASLAKITIDAQFILHSVNGVWIRSIRIK